MRRAVRAWQAWVPHYGYVMETGRIVLQGPSERLLHDDYVRQAYLGGHGATA
ncbi:MAG TPA: hypothetical protein VMS96_15385 [Terriglobales bacterium]|nr:hypothetical protein [Terriglobales bacterium]